MTRRDHRPGRGPVRGIVSGYLMTLAAVAVIGIVVVVACAGRSSAATKAGVAPAGSPSLLGLALVGFSAAFIGIVLLAWTRRSR
jgi:uncharacterized membrane protein